MSKFKLSNTINVDVDIAEQIINDFFAVVPNVRNFLEALKVYGKNTGQIRTAAPFKRIRWFPRWLDIQADKNHPDAFKWLGEIERASMNTPILYG